MLEKIVVINKYKIKIVYIKLLLFFNLIDLMPENAMIPKYKAKTYIPPEHKISIIVLLKPKLKLLQLDINCIYAVLFNPDPIIGWTFHAWNPALKSSVLICPESELNFAFNMKCTNTTAIMVKKHMKGRIIFLCL
ncbi:hypothetical protein EFM15_02975 [Lactobacillus delbrueckii]|nr:hypothetical protein [Lactobacillus delbrueckii]